MGRYSPTVVPQVPDPLQVVDSMWQGYMGHKAGARADRGLELQEEGLEIRREEAKTRARSTELDEYDRGYRRGTRPNRVPDENLPPSLRSGAKVTGGKAPAIGLQPAEKEGLTALHERLGQARGKYEPQIVAKPGALVPGMGIFADRPVSSAELPQETQWGGMVPDERYEQVNEDTYLDPSGTREARMLDRQTAYEQFRQTLSNQYEDEDVRRRVQALIAAGVDEEEAVVEAMNMDLPGRSSSGSRPHDAFTMPQAISYLRQANGVWEENDYGEQVFVGYREGWDEDRILQEARKLAVGSYASTDPEDISTGGINEGEYLPAGGISFEELLQGYERDPFQVRGGEAPGGVAPAPEPVMSDEDVAEMRELYSGMDPEAATEELIELGVTEADIERIIGG